jgi:hypothetical protein
MRHARQLLQIHRGINLHVAERIEIFDRDVEFFLKKLGGVGHDGGAAGKEQPLRGGPALLAAVKLQGLVDLNVQFGHELAGNFGNGRLIRIFRLLVGAAQTDKALGDLDFLGLGKFQFLLVGKILGDGIGPQVDAAGKHLALFEKEQVAGFGANVQQHGAILQIAVIEAEGIAERRRRGVAQIQLQLGVFRNTEQALDNSDLMATSRLPVRPLAAEPKIW